MKLDIVIPTLNEEANLKSLLPFLKSQSTIHNINIIVVDASESTDSSKLVCEQNEIKYIKIDQSRRSIQMNIGAFNLSGEIIMFLHADVKPPYNFYKLIETAVYEDYQAGCFAYRFDRDTFLLKMNGYFTKFKGLYTGGGDQIHFISRVEFVKLSGYDENHPIMEDFDFYLRVKQSKLNYIIINTPAVVSARKYENNSWLKVNLINLIALINYKVNRDPQRVKSFYNRWLSD